MTITISIPQIVININSNQNLNLDQMAHTIDELIAEVAKTKTLEDGAKTLISGLRQKVADAIANAGTVNGTSDAELAAIQAKVDETFAQLAASNSDFAGALTENTDTSTTPPVVPPVVDTPAPTTGTTPPVVDTPAPVDTTPAPTPAPVDVPATPATPAPVDVPATPTTPDAGTPAAPSAPTAPAPTTPVTNPDGSTTI